MTTTQPPQQRHSKLIYGSNAVILAIIAAALVIAINYLFSQQTALRTRSFTGISLSPASVKLVQELDQKTKGTYTIANLFEAKFPSRQRTDDEQQKAENARLVADQLREYARHTSHIQVISPGTRDDVEVMIKDRFASEETVIRNALTDLEKFIKEMEVFCKKEGENFSQLAQQKADEEIVLIAVDLRRRFTDEIPERIAEARRVIEDQTNATLPRWNVLVNVTRISLEAIDENLKAFTEIFEHTKKSKIDKNTPPAVVNIINRVVEIAPEVTKQREAIKALNAKFDGLPTSKLSGINLPNEPCLVIFPPAESKDAQEIKIITRGMMFTDNKRAGQNTAIFEGEGPISSAILPLVRPDKVHVVFVGSDRGFLQQFGEVASRLEKANFSVDLWAPLDPREMAQMDPRMPPPDPKPKYAGKGVVWVVFTSEPKFTPPGQTDPLTDEITRHMDAGGATMFLASPAASTVSLEEPEAATTQPATAQSASTQPATKPAPAPVRKFIFNDLLAKFGVTVDSNLAVVSTFNKTDPRGVVFKITSGLVTASEYTDDAITEPLESLRTGFGIPMPDNSGAYNSMFLVSRVRAVKTNGAASSEIIYIPAANETYFPTDGFIKGVNWINDKNEVMIDDDPAAVKTPIQGPFPIAAKGSIGSGADEKRVVVVGNVSFAHTALVQAADIVQRPNGLMRVSVLPGNSELFVNAVMWLAKDENRIAISANAGSASRIKVAPATKRTIDWTILYTGLPLLALIAGAMVWKIRRR
jgi:hypothetical protein